MDQEEEKFEELNSREAQRKNSRRRKDKWVGKMGLEFNLNKLIKSSLRFTTNPSSFSNVYHECFKRFHTGSINSSNQSASSKRFIRRSQTDPYGKLKSSNRGEKVYLARSAHKLIQLDSNFKLFSKFKHQKINVLELGSSPGGWTEVIIERLKEIPTEMSRKDEVHHHHHLICCDLKPISNSILVNLPLNLKFDFLQGDFLTSELQTKILELFQKSTTLSNSNLKNSSIPTIILSDLLAPISGIPIKDSQNSFDLCLSVLNLTQSLLKDQIPNQDDTLIIKHLQSDLTHQLLYQLKSNWNSIKWFKPLASRSESREGYFIARQRKP